MIYRLPLAVVCPQLTHVILHGPSQHFPLTTSHLQKAMCNARHTIVHEGPMRRKVGVVGVGSGVGWEGGAKRVARGERGEGGGGKARRGGGGGRVFQQTRPTSDPKSPNLLAIPVERVGAREHEPMQDVDVTCGWFARGHCPSPDAFPLLTSAAGKDF